MKKTRGTKRLLGLLLCLTMVIGLFACMTISASAATVYRDDVTALSTLASGTGLKIYQLTSADAGKTLTSGIYYITDQLTLAGADAASDRETGGNGLKIADGATVYLYLASGQTLTVTGGSGYAGTAGTAPTENRFSFADQVYEDSGITQKDMTSIYYDAGLGGTGATGGGAGIYVPDGATLAVFGSGTLNATGGAGGAGGAGAAGGNTAYYFNSWHAAQGADAGTITSQTVSSFTFTPTYSGTATKNVSAISYGAHGGTGGAGGGGAAGGGAGIGTNGANGTVGAAGNFGASLGSQRNQGQASAVAQTSANAGSIYIAATVKGSIQGGSGGTSTATSGSAAAKTGSFTYYTSDADGTTATGSYSLQDGAFGGSGGAGGSGSGVGQGGQGGQGGGSGDSGFCFAAFTFKDTTETIPDTIPAAVSGTTGSKGADGTDCRQTLSASQLPYNQVTFTGASSNGTQTYALAAGGTITAPSCSMTGFSGWKVSSPATALPAAFGQSASALATAGTTFSAGDKISTAGIYGNVTLMPVITATGTTEYLAPVYVKKNDVTAGITGMEVKTCSNATVVDSSTTWGTAGSTTWYVVNQDITIAGRITVNGDVNLILADGCTLTASSGITVMDSNSLTIYGQAGGTGALNATASGKSDAAIGGTTGHAGKHITINGGVITVTTQERSYGAGIGGGGADSYSIYYYGGYSGTDITINGGVVTVTTGTNAYGAGIGGSAGTDGDAEAITINGGTVTAISKGSGAGIGGGFHGTCKNIIINDGNVTAQGATGIGGGNSGGAGTYITIHGGTVNATGNSGAGIGGGKAYGSFSAGFGYMITITGGTVNATGNSGAGIGGGSASASNGGGECYDVSITGGTVTATGNSGAGIGGGGGYSSKPGGDCYGVTIDGGLVTANGSFDCAGIGGGRENYGTSITISGGTVTANGGGYGAGIGGGSNGEGTSITISGGTVTATGGTNGAGIGGGYKGLGYTISISGGTVTATGSRGIGSGASASTAGEKLTVSTSLDIKAGSAANPMTVVCKTRTDSTDLAQDTTFTQPYVRILAHHPHTMVWVVTNAASDSLTAVQTCSSGDPECEYLNSYTSPITLKLTASDADYDGTAKTATLSVLDAEGKATTAEGLYSAITYSQGDTVLASAPSGAGTYTASVTATAGNGQKTTISVSFEIKKVPSAVVTAPTAKTLTYDGTAQTLVNSGSATNGTMNYALGTDSTTAPASGWSTTPSAATNAGTYYVWYQSVGDANHSDTTPACVQVTIGQKELTVTQGTSYQVTRVYDGTKDPGTESGSLAVSGIVATDTGVTVTTGTIPDYPAAAVGSYTIEVPISITGDTNGNYKLKDDATKVSVNASITQKEVTLSWSDTALTYNGSAQKPGATVTNRIGNDVVNVTVSGEQTNVGTYTATATTLSNANYKLPDANTQSFTISQKNITVEITPNGGTYGGTITPATAVLNGLVSGETVNPVLTYTGTANDGTVISSTTAPKLAGSYQVTATLPENDVAANYSLTGTTTADFVVAKAEQAAPTAEAADETIRDRHDGKVTYADAAGHPADAPELQFRGATYTDYTNITTVVDDRTVDFSALAPGDYSFRYPESANYKASAVVTVTVEAGRGLKVTFEEQGGSPVTDYDDLGWQQTLAYAGHVIPTTRKNAYTFLEWNTAPNGTGDTLTEQTTFEADTTFYAIWIYNYQTFTVSAKDTEQGTITVDQTEAGYNQPVTITVTPDEGYEVSSVTVTDPVGQTVPVTDNGDGTYTFYMPAGDVSVSVTFQKAGSDEPDEPDEPDYSTCPRDETCVYAHFTDADPTAWYHDGVHYCVQNGIMNGTATDTFAPEGSLTRAMLVTMLWRMEGQPTVNYAMTFTDVASDVWYTEAVRWAQASGIVTGYDADTFGPGDNVTREQLATILYRYAKYQGVDTSAAEDTNILSYDDAADVSSWAMTAMQWACGEGIINGMDGSLVPQGNATRAQAACMLQRYCTLD